jgi:phosphoglycolate phosphatase
MSRTAFIFDLDGTLVNSFAQIEKAVNATRVASGFNALPASLVFEKIGLPIDFLISDLDLSPSRKEQFIRDFRAVLSIEIDKENPLFPGVKEFIEDLSTNEITMGIATSKPSHLAIQVIENSDIADRFHHIQGTDGFPSKPNPEVILRCMSALKTDRAIMFGDRIEDMQAALDAEVLGVGIAQTFHSREQLLDAGASIVFESFISARESTPEIQKFLQKKR